MIVLANTITVDLEYVDVTSFASTTKSLKVKCFVGDASPLSGSFAASLLSKSHTRGVLAREKKKQAACERRSKGGVGTIRMDDSSGSASTRRVRCGAGDGASRRRRRRRRRDDADDTDDADDRGPRRERVDRVFAANGRSVSHSVGEGAKRKRIEANARRWLEASNARRSRSIVAVAWRWKRLVISSAVARVVRTSSPTRLETPRRSPTNVPRGTLHVTRVITRKTEHLVHPNERMKIAMSRQRARPGLENEAGRKTRRRKRGEDDTRNGEDHRRRCGRNGRTGRTESPRKEATDGERARVERR